MKSNHIKLMVTAAAILFLTILTTINIIAPRNVRAVSNDDPDAMAVYKAKCAMCHTAKADKFFDPAKSIEAHTQVILKGVSTSKPPMPGFESKGMTAEQAKALTEYMMSLRNAGGSNTNAPSNNSNNANDANTNSSNNTNTNNANQNKMSDEQVAAAYKAKCAMCHTAKAEKFFDPAKKDEELVAVTLEGKSTSKPPMPAYKTKSMTNEEALALVAYMKGLKDAAKK